MDRASIITVSEFAALLALFAFGVVHVCRKNRRRKVSPFLAIPGASKRQMLRGVVCGALIALAGISFYECGGAIRTGKMYVNLSRYDQPGFTVSRATNPSGFWMAVSGHVYLGLLFLYVSTEEIVFAIRRSNKSLQATAAAPRS
jgi:hypothetical protein